MQQPVAADDDRPPYEAGPGFYADSRFKRDRVFVEELKTIRAAQGEPPGSDPRAPQVDPDSEPEPDVGHELVGLALSGGGIRSATFGLGAVQALNENQVLDKIDYMSTVSGGGYLGACISCLLAQNKALPFGHRLGRLEHAAFRHLRNHANYIAPGGTGRVLRIPALMLQGMVRNLFAVLPFVLGLVIVALLINGPGIKDQLTDAQGGFSLLYHVPMIVCIVGLLVWMLVVAPWIETKLETKGSDRTRRTPREIREVLLKWTARILGLALVVTFLTLQPYAIWLFTQVRYGLPILTLLSGVGVAVVAMALLRRTINRIVGPFAETTLILGLAILGPLTLWFIFLLLSSWAISPPAVVIDLFERFVGEYRGATMHRSVLIAHLANPPTVASTEFTVLSLWVYAVTGFVLLFLFISLYDVNAASVHTFYRDQLSKAFLFTYNDDEAFRDERPMLEPFDHIRLSELSEQRPLHLINSAINIQSSRSRNMRGRNADFFIFSRLFTGGEYTGYCRTKDLERQDPRLDLAAAMAISGAALSPNAGRHTNRALRFLLMLVNVRLGYWLRNPKHVAREAAREKEALLRKRLSRQALEHAVPGQGWRLKTGVSPYYLFLEATGSLHENRDYIYVTDGGHIDNLGAFELLRRRCRYIVVFDAEADPKMTFEGLAHLIRLARIDLGIDIDIDVTDLRKSALGLVRAHCALGKINYSRTQVGHLLYVKASLTGDENEYISEYRARNPDFPHETTADQFFNEAQFEAYRALGHHIVAGLFETRRSEARIEMLDQKPLSYVSTGEWFADLSRWLRPQPANLDDFLELQREAAALERRMSDLVFAPYTRQIYQEYQSIWRLDEEDSEVSQRKQPEIDGRILHLVNDQLLLMERAVLRLRLDDPRNWLRPSNRGVMNLFRRWSQAELFRLAWAVCTFEYSPDLQRFCRDALKLRHTIEWRLVSRSELNAYERRYVDQCQAGDVYAAYLGVPEAPASPNPSTTGGLFLVAIAIMQRKGNRSVLRCLRIRDTYRRQGLSLALAQELRAKLDEDHDGPPFYRLGNIDPKVEASMRQIFEQVGFVDHERAMPMGA